ncbi:MAG: ArsB/NhaD family transporter [Candidatus Muirbacterium halophilum]|nr:ArsB/NhaD family transporter [Candidatus Muirbacterium halophilum]
MFGFTSLQIYTMIIFFGSLALIVSEKFHRTIIALFGASLIILLRILDQNEAISYVDFNTLGMLIGMMIIVEISRKSGLFEYLAIKMVKISKGKPVLVFIYFSLLTGILSALLDNVTTILLIAPITFLVTDIMKINIYPFLMAEIFASNIGGTATLIGDPPNILIGSKNAISFNAFLFNLGPVSLVLMFVMIGLLWFKYRKTFKKIPGIENKLASLNENTSIKDKSLLIKSILVITLTLTLFIFHDALSLMPATVALLGASILMIISIKEPSEFFESIEWNTIFFFTGLFIIIGGMESSGLIQQAANYMLEITTNPLVLVMIILWSSSILVCVISSVPFVITMIPIIQVITGPQNLALTKAETMPFWWALALGACLGANGTMFASAANLVVCSIADKYRPGMITFKKFLKESVLITFISIVFSSFYIYFRYFYFK